MTEFTIGMKVRRKGDLTVPEGDATVIGVDDGAVWVKYGDGARVWTFDYSWEPIPTTIPVMLPVENVEHWAKGCDWLANACAEALAKHREGSNE